MNPLVSVYCLAYNHGKYIRNALEGFVNQKTSFPFEVFVHDDASTDNTADIIREYAEKYPDIIKPIYQTVNQYSKCVRIVRDYIYPHMKGKYIAICEGDDYWIDENKLQIQAEWLEKHPDYSFCVHNTKRIDVKTGKEYLYNSGEDRDLSVEEILEKPGAQFHTSSYMYRKEFFPIPEGFYIKHYGDYPLGIYLSLVGKVRYISRVMSVYRYQTEGSWTVTMHSGSDSAEKMTWLFSERKRMLLFADEFSHKKYTETIARIVRRNEFTILWIQGDYKKMKEMYKEYYDELDYREKIKLGIRYHLPKTIKIYRRLFQR